MTVYQNLIERLHAAVHLAVYDVSDLLLVQMWCGRICVAAARAQLAQLALPSIDRPHLAPLETIKIDVCNATK